MRQFYRCFPICDSLRHELRWSHYRRLLSVESENARLWYMHEAAENVWSTRQLDRQISTLYYDRLLASRDKETVRAEAREKWDAVRPESYIKDPYVLELLNLKDYLALRETTLEQALIDNLQTFLLKMGRLTHQDVGQMDSYIRMFDALYKNDEIFAAKYKLYLPTEEQLKHEIEEQKALFALRNNNK